MEVLFWVAGVIVACFGLVVFRGAPYVPTRKAQLDQAFDKLYPVGLHDVVIDVGSGDGTVLRAAAKRGAKAIGYELNPVLVLLSRWLNRSYAHATTVHWRDFWRQNLPQDATLVYAFLEGRDIAKMELLLVRQARLRNKPLHFVSYGFELPNTKAVKRVGPLLLYRFEPA
ncbi:MAG TPA: hypothetical protein VFZ48_02910 [Candidatus Saccharimonadales bacterium]